MYQIDYVSCSRGLGYEAEIFIEVPDCDGMIVVYATGPDDQCQRFQTPSLKRAKEIAKEWCGENHFRRDN